MTIVGRKKHFMGGYIMSNVPTPHIEAKAGDFAQTVLMPGDPLRAKFIAETFLEKAELVNNIRGMQGYTGFYKGKRVSVMASGMGMPSMGIYSYELFNFYDVKNIIRIGTAGMIDPNLHIGDVVFGMGSCTDSNFASQYRLPGTFAPICSFELLNKAIQAAKELNIAPVVGNLFSSDAFYDDADSLLEWQKMGVIAGEMESAALYMNAARAGKNALAICTISDNPFTGEKASAEERQYNFRNMMMIALEIA